MISLILERGKGSFNVLEGERRLSLEEEKAVTF